MHVDWRRHGSTDAYDHALVRMDGWMHAYPSAGHVGLAPGGARACCWHSRLVPVVRKDGHPATAVLEVEDHPGPSGAADTARGRWLRGGRAEGRVRSG